MEFFIANWKMNMNLESIYNWVQWWQSKEIPQYIKVIIAPSFLHMPLLAESGLANIELCGQDGSVYDKGAHTGEIGAFQLKDFAHYCIVGHSEKHDPQTVVLAKAQKCLEYAITPIICFDEAKKAKEYYLPKCILTWEDPQTISKNGIYTPMNSEEIRIGIELIREQLPNDAIVVYGGSVNSKNSQELSQVKGLDGLLIGNASTSAEHFYEIMTSTLGGFSFSPNVPKAQTN